MNRAEPTLVEKRYGSWPLIVMLFVATGFVLTGTWGSRVGAAEGADGAALFKTYCASCHGTGGTGHGPMAPLLRHQPPDLTQLWNRNRGVFPLARVRRIVEGRDIEYHGDRDMPVWGDAFKTTPEGRSQEATDARIDAVVLYLDSIQIRSAH